MLDKKIIAAPMTGVSNAKLACAVDSAGGLASVQYYNDIFDETYDPFIYLEQQLDEFYISQGHNNLIVSHGNIERLYGKGAHEKILDICDNFGVTYIESLHAPHTVNPDPRFEWIQRSPLPNEPNWFHTDSNADYLMFKTPKAAGGGGNANNLTLPNTKQPVILSGGVYDKTDVDYYLSLGAIAVEVGTVFAASKESCLSDATKQSIIDKGLKDLGKFTSDNRQGLNIQDHDDKGFNHMHSLLKGINDPTQGHIYAGEAVERITEILPIADIMKRLTCE